MAASATLILTAPSELRAEVLVIPFTCEMMAGAPRLTHASPTAFPIVGARDALPFSSCSAHRASDCETILVHRFAIACDGQTVSWATVAASASALGVELPTNLPAGYAPIAELRGRIVLPGFGRTTRLATVARHSLSPDSVIADSNPRRHEDPLRWVTVVSPSEGVASSSAILKVSGVVVALLLVLFAGGFAMARWYRVQPFDAHGFLNGGNERLSLAGWFSTRRLADQLGSAFAGVAALLAWLGRFSRTHPTSESDDFGHFINSLALAKARIAQTEMVVSSLGAGLALRDVLQAELDALRKRADDVAQRGKSLAPERAGAMVRGLTRDLDRIARIARGAGEERAGGEDQAASAAPSTVFEAYRVLGLNVEAPQAAVKKVVDALRMSWHPDHAQNEPDRLYREQRIKQINAAWDLLKGNGGQAAAA